MDKLSRSKGLQRLFCPAGMTFLGESKGRYIGAAPCGDLVIVDENKNVLFKHTFNGVIASAALKDNYVGTYYGVK